MESEEVIDVVNNSQADKIDVIDLTKESPVSNRQLQYIEPHILRLSMDHSTAERSNNHRARVISPTYLENMIPPLPDSILEFLNAEFRQQQQVHRNRDREHTRHRMRRRELTESRRTARQLQETIELDDSSSSDEENTRKNFTVESDTGESISLTCPICLESLSSKQKPTVTKCGHIFCSTCLQTSLRRFKKCPTCKSSVSLKSCIRIYF
ncbi:hypothetical protein DMN91_003855 [Ooceraea biroi]|uniref:RING-type domain-containing protein n=1 Tax=Ooceraea biroi TaxID=2015173 RepID=A0A026W7P0_OOCBI|nr:E3 ubiquitin-protein ligase bre-1 [Ooceraea biroi]XP_011343051.1 E3 ubiquitin-protein ligase bre-1 [Ooceraea biroi]EZA51631.1 hypothetical protein X777_08815 [Ooceraea biroi]RLU23649.1 hypothetical protein DMN91_003855 [Ooceraea biroi]